MIPESHRAPQSKNEPMLSQRQRRLLRLLDALGGSAKRVDFQKLLFLYCQQEATENTYEFIPYKFGAFSFTSYADRRKLIERGLLVDDDQYWQLSAAGQVAAGNTRNSLAAAFVARVGNLRGDALVAETYRQYPYYAIRSEIAERILRGDHKALRKINAAKPQGTHPAVSTIGYEGRSLESYLNTLIKAGIDVLCDVRKNPISRKYGFSKSTLTKGCEGVGIRYEHLPQLGISSEQRQELHTQSDYDKLFKHYEKKELPLQAMSLEKIHQWVQSGERVALTCYERLPQQCHRHCVTDAIEREFGKEFAARHL